MIGTLDIGAYIHVTIVYMSLQTCIYTRSNQTVNCLHLTKVAWELLQLGRLCCTLEFAS